MFHIWKEILVPDRVFDVRSKRWYAITPKDVRDGARNLSTMHERGRLAPIVYEHQNVEVGDSAEWKANFAKYTIGYAGPARVSTAEDVRKGIASRAGTLLARHDIFDRADVDRLKRLRVSPKLYQGYQDSDGKEYNGATVVHIAATNSPAQYQQAPFKIELSDDTRLFIAYPRATPKPTSRSGRKCPPHNRSRRGTARALSTTPGASDMADEKDEKPEGGEGAEGEGKNADLEAVISAIKTAFPGAVISDKVSNWSELVIALESNGAGEPEEPEPEPEPEPAPGSDTTAPAGGAPMLMSVTNLPENRRREILESVAAERAQLKARVNAALKARKCDGVEANKLLRVATAVELSVTTDGDVVDTDRKAKRWETTVERLTEIEKRKPGHVGEAVELSATTAGDPAPAHLTANGVSDGIKAEMERAAAAAARLSVKTGK